jgi:Methyltransferase domain
MDEPPPKVRIADAWDREYLTGRYSGEEPVHFILDILSTAREHGISRGLYLGCGNGRNFVPLIEAGLELTGVDLSSVAIRQLSERLPSHAGRLYVGDMSVLPHGSSYPLLIGIQVFQHGDRATCHQNIQKAQHLLERGGLFCIRVNAAGTKYEYRNEVVETGEDGSETIRYLAGPKTGLLIHFFCRSELESLFESEFRSILRLRHITVKRDSPRVGHWVQWEAIWQKTKGGPGGASSALRPESQGSSWLSDSAGARRGQKRTSPRVKSVTYIPNGSE